MTVYIRAEEVTVDTDEGRFVLEEARDGVRVEDRVL